MSLTENGYGKITEIEKYRIQHRGGSGLLNIKINDKTGKVVKSLRVIDTDNVILISSNGISIQFNVSSVRKTGRAASGVRIMRIEKGNKVVDAQVINKAAQTEGISVAEESNQLNGGDEGKDEVQAE
jgi:DNA gyrase subunit A